MSTQQCYYIPVHRTPVQGHWLYLERVVYCGCSPHLCLTSRKLYGACAYGTHLAILRNKFSLYRMGIKCVARYEGWSVIDATSEGNQGML